MKLVKPTKGNVRFEDAQRKMQLVFQAPAGGARPAHDDCRGARRAAHHARPPDRKRVPALLEAVGLGPELHGAPAARWFDRRVQQAESLRHSDPARSARLWASLDREAVDRALWVPVLNLRAVEFVSARVRHYQYSRAYHFLPAQASVR